MKESNGDFLLDVEQAHNIFDNPGILYVKPAEPIPVKQPSEPEPPKKDPIDLFIEKLYAQMKSSKHFPNSLRELERQIKKNVVKKGEPSMSNQAASVVDDIKSFVENVLRRMNDRGMFTKKMRTGESKEHAKE